jgi:hypothetical protein
MVVWVRNEFPSFKTMLARVKSKHASVEMKRARVETVAVRHPGGDSLLYGL